MVSEPSALPPIKLKPNCHLISAVMWLSGSDFCRQKVRCAKTSDDNSGQKSYLFTCRILFSPGKSDRKGHCLTYSCEFREWSEASADWTWTAARVVFFSSRPIGCEGFSLVARQESSTSSRTACNHLSLDYTFLFLFLLPLSYPLFPIIIVIIILSLECCGSINLWKVVMSQLTTSVKKTWKTNHLTPFNFRFSMILLAVEGFSRFFALLYCIYHFLTSDPV